MIYHGGVDATGAPMLKQARALGIKAVFAFGDGACTDEMVKLAGPAAEGMACSRVGVPDEAVSKEFMDAFTAKYGRVVLYAPYFYDATIAVVEAMTRANSTDPSRFAPELFSVSFIGATGKVEFDRKGDRKSADYTIFRHANGRLRPILIIRDKRAMPFPAN